MLHYPYPSYGALCFCPLCFPYQYSESLPQTITLNPYLGSQMGRYSGCMPGKRTTIVEGAFADASSFNRHIGVNSEHHGNLFFWHFQNRHIANRQRTVIWLNGGPGCSSMDGALMEVGPYRLKDNEHLVYNDGAWDEFANLLFIDNPVGTGFSYVDTDSYLHELTEMANHMVIFLEKFFDMFPEYQENDVSPL